MIVSTIAENGDTARLVPNSIMVEADDGCRSMFQPKRRLWLLLDRFYPSCAWLKRITPWLGLQWHLHITF